MRVEQTAMLVERLSAVIGNPANIYVRPEATKAYIRLADSEAGKLLRRGHEEEAGMIWSAIADYRYLVTL